MRADGSSRVLVVVPHPRYTGVLALDGMGIVPGSLVTWDMRAVRAERHLVLELAERVGQAIQHTRPAVVVLGAPAHERPDAARLRAALERELARRGVQAQPPASSETAQVLFAGCRDLGEARDRLLSWFVLPELERRARSGSSGDWYWRNVWHAAAIAVAVLIERRPLAAAALARPAALGEPAFSRLLRDRLSLLESP